MPAKVSVGNRRLVYVPCRFESIDGPYSVESADGWVEQVQTGQLDLVDARFCLIAELVGGDGTGRYRVKFRDRTEVWIHRTSEWKYIPYGSSPYTPADLVDLPVLAA